MSVAENSRLVKVEARQDGNGYILTRDGSPFFVKGAGGFQHIARLARVGGNSLRTWGVEQTEQALPEVRRWGLTLCAGLWMVPPRQGFDYSDFAARKAQYDALKQQVLKLKDEPSLLVWGVGNELELEHETTSSVWTAVEEVATFIKSVDKWHPVMTVLSRVNEDALNMINELCPSIDFVCFNSYGDVETVQAKLDAIGWSRPYLVTEWGANGHWEVNRTDWGAEIEPTSTEKAEQIRCRYGSLDGSRPQCMGSYLFLWGNKQERTPTWYGLFSEDGRATEAVEVIGSLWSDVDAKPACPRIGALRLKDHGADESLVVRGGEMVPVAFEILRGEISSEDVFWRLAHESNEKKVGGDEEEPGRAEALAVESESINQIRFRAPRKAGEYRLYLEVLGQGGWIATANFPFRVQ